MFLPLFDSRLKNARKPFITWILILICVLVYGYQFNMDSKPQGEELLFFFTYQYGLVPKFLIFQGTYLSLITYIFLHGSTTHLLFNMLYLFIFGDNLEATFGRIGYFLFFLLGGVVAALFHTYFNMGAETPLIGASGAISAVMGAYLVFFPKSKVLTIIAVFPIRIFAIILMIIWFGIQFVSLLHAHVPEMENSVAWWAHIGGFSFGVVFGLFIRIFKKPPELEED